MTKGGCHESTRFTDGSGAVSPHRRGLRTNLRTVRQGESPAAATGCYQRLMRAIGGDRPLCRSLSFWATRGCLLLGVKRTFSQLASMSVIDPKCTLPGARLER